LLFWITAEKDKLALEHHAVLEAQRALAAQLKEKLMQAEPKHTQVLKEAQAAGEAKLEEALRDFTDASGQMRKDLDEGGKLLKEAENRNSDLLADQAEFDMMVIQTDQQALSKFFLFFHACQLISSGKVLFNISSFFSSRAFPGLSSACTQEGHGYAG
jgi:hypothetical protein